MAKFDRLGQTRSFAEPRVNEHYAGQSEFSLRWRECPFCLTGSYKHIRQSKIGNGKDFDLIS